MYRVSAISYLNTAPFAYGLRHSSVYNSIELLYDYPSECARKLKNHEADVSLLPVGALGDFDSYQIISNYCIGSEGPVRTVALMSNVPINQISKIYLDFHSRTSVLLTRILCHNIWRIKPTFTPLKPTDSYLNPGSNEAVVLIGDKVFEAEKHFKFVTDLSDEWHKAYHLPFVFAVWVTTTNLPDHFIKDFNKALSLGVNSIKSAVEEFAPLTIPKEEAVAYLSKNISYSLDERKHRTIELFQKLCHELPNY